MDDLGKRLITAVIGIILLIFIVFKGGFALALGIAIMSLIGIWEFDRALKNIKLNPIKNIGYIASLAMFLVNISGTNKELMMMFILNLTLFSSLIMFLIRDDISIADLGLTLLMVMYIPFSLTHIYYLDGTKYIWLVFLIAFGSDTFAYFAGNLLGKNKLSPNISPNKTIEGSIGGIIGAAALAGIYGFFIGIKPIWKLIVLGVIGSIFSQTGDLIASKIKRKADIKDYGFIMPGHGGVLDRFDSIILSAPLVYYFVEYILL